MPLYGRQISSACAHLRTAEKLLLNPTGGAIAEAGFVLQQALLLAKTCENANEATAEKIGEFQVLCLRVKTLLEGALRVQWAYIHRISAATQTYTPGPSARTWIPSQGTLSFHA